MLAQTARHFFPDLNDHLQQLPDGRDQESITYPRHFLAWWGILLYVLQLQARRNLDFDLSADSRALANVNRLARTNLATRPVHDTLDYFIGHSSAAGFAAVRRYMIRALLRQKALDGARLQGRVRLLADGTGHLAFGRKHCDRCLVQRHETHTVYLHKVLEVKVLGPAGLVFSLGSAFIENADDPGAGSQQQRKQDCELKALDRAAEQIKRDFPQTRFCLGGDSEFGCGRVLQLCKDKRWSYLLVFKPGRTPALYEEFQALLRMCPGNRLLRASEGGAVRLYRWVEELPYEDSEGREWVFAALELQETVDGETTTFAWITDLEVKEDTVEEVARSARQQWCIENEGFNRQKNSGLNLEHVYSTDPDKLQAYYLLLQIAHILLQLLEKGSLLRQLAATRGKTPWQWLGSLKNLAKRLLEGLRLGTLPEEIEPVGQIRFAAWNTS